MIITTITTVMDEIKISLDEFGKILPLTPLQRRSFYQRCLDIYQGKITVIMMEESLIGFGFCAIFYDYFKLHMDFKLVPELLTYEPKIFYFEDGEETSYSSQFWFPRGQNQERIKILEEILAKEF